MLMFLLSPLMLNSFQLILIFHLLLDMDLFLILIFFVISINFKSWLTNINSPFDISIFSLYAKFFKLGNISLISFSVSLFLVLYDIFSLSAFNVSSINSVFSLTFSVLSKSNSSWTWAISVFNFAWIAFVNISFSPVIVAILTPC